MIPFFYSHSKYSKYLVENIDYVMKANHTLSPRESLRMREGSFINATGGKSNNLEADLRQEHSVRNRKDLIRHLGANKTEHAMSCVTEAADTIDGIVRSISRQMNIPQKSGRHTKLSTSEDMNKIATVLRQVRPFHYKQGRQCSGFKKILPSPLMKIKKTEMNKDISSIISRLFDDSCVETEAESDRDE